MKDSKEKEEETETETEAEASPKMREAETEATATLGIDLERGVVTGPAVEDPTKTEGMKEEKLLQDQVQPQ